tara:strand:+ start:27814 stop:29133 length:1320 start_codon:yes stop_codon:yes gene_type:complete
VKVVIIGAGATGMAAAYDLSANGHLPIIYESAPFLGGHASTFDIGGAQIERGYHHWFTNDIDIINFVNEIGLGDRIKWFESKVGTLVNGKIYPFGSPIDLLKFSALSIIDRLKLGFATLYIQKKKNYKDFEHITASHWLRKNVGKNGYETFWEPMLRGKFGVKFYEKISMAWIWGKMHTRLASRGSSFSKEKLGYPIGSFSEIFEVLSNKIIQSGGEINLSTSVSKILVDNGKFTGLELAKNNTKTDLQYDACLVTTPSHIFQKLVGNNLTNSYREKLDSIKYMSAVLLILCLDRPLTDKYWLNIADRSIPFVAVIEHTNFINSDLYSGKHIVYLSNYLDSDNYMYNMSHNELLEHYIPHLKKINSDFNSDWIQNSYHHRIDCAQPIIGVNYSKIIPSHKTPVKNLFLANTSQVYPEDRGTNYSVRMGRNLAKMIMETC